MEDFMARVIEGSFYANVAIYPVFFLLSILVFCRLRSIKQDKAIIATWGYNEAKMLFYMIYLVLYYLLLVAYDGN